MPIGVVLVLLYDPDAAARVRAAVADLPADQLRVRAAVARARASCEERVHDLEILNATARRLSASLQLEELVEAVARETCKAMPEAEAVALVHRRAGRESELVIDGFDRTSRQVLPPADGARARAPPAG